MFPFFSGHTGQWKLICLLLQVLSCASYPVIEFASQAICRQSWPDFWKSSPSNKLRVNHISCIRQVSTSDESRSKQAYGSLSLTPELAEESRGLFWKHLYTVNQKIHSWRISRLITMTIKISMIIEYPMKMLYRKQYPQHRLVCEEKNVCLKL